MAVKAFDIFNREKNNLKKAKKNLKILCQKIEAELKRMYIYNHNLHEYDVFCSIDVDNVKDYLVPEHNPYCYIQYVLKINYFENTEQFREKCQDNALFIPNDLSYFSRELIF